ncbi:hypothetical protein M569_07515, partial [Genlisea aurea]
GTKKRKRMTLRSPLWSEFERYETVDGWKARCKACGTEVKADPQKNGTSGLKSHYASCKVITIPKRFSVSSLEVIRLVIISLAPSGAIPKLFENALIELIISAELPFKFVSRPEFVHFMSIVYPKFTVPSRWTVQRD